MSRITNRRWIALAGLCIILVLPNLALPETRPGDLEIEFCDFKVPPDIAQANASFPAAFLVQVGDDGRPVKVDKITNDFLSDEPFISCIKNWRLPRGTQRVAVTFTWKHADGWTEVAISGGEANYRIKIQPGAFSQYKPGGDPGGNKPQKKVPHSDGNSKRRAKGPELKSSERSSWFLRRPAPSSLMVRVQD